jgi:hypothetical protein
LDLDGTDDSLSTATQSAGAFGSNVDWFAAVKRDTAGNVVFSYQTAGGAAFIAMAESGSGSVCHANVGTPTVWVDGVQLTGGTSVTRGTLHTALTVGVWHILELRGLDLSAWTVWAEGAYTSYVHNGGKGAQVLVDAPSDADRTKTQTFLADLYGVTLP